MELTFVDAIRQALIEEMRRDPAVFLMGEDIGVYGGAFKATAGLVDEFGPQRVIDTPLAESAIVGAAIGASYTGMRPVVEMQFMDFVACCFNQITNFAAKSHYRWNAPVPIVIRGPVGGGVHGGPFHSQNPEMYFVHTPGLKVVEPATPGDAFGLLLAAIRDNNPVLFLEHKFLYRRLKEDVAIDAPPIPLGRAKVARPGRDLSVITYGAMVQTALATADQLAARGIEVEVLDLRTLLPLDCDAIAATARKTSKVLILHEDTRTGGIAGEITAILQERCFDDLDGPILRLTSGDAPVPFSPPLEEAFLPSAQALANHIERLARF
ncbi:MAG TPA: alpha-ketoacid dehydrogenase subunit beta [Terriglobales bacterium]|nr:alpha-ketoacid dehydrogenase subunit beta [Terriglobales bacterium]